MKNSIKKHYLLFAALLFIVFPALFVSPVQAQKKTVGATMKIKLFFPKEDSNNGIELVAVERTIPKTTRTAEAALRELFKGVGENEKKMGLVSTYEAKDIVTGREECQGDKMKPLGDYLIGVTIKKGGGAVVNFRPEGECYLQTAITAGDYVMKPIDATLKQFPSIKTVDYAINGKIITEWDA